MSRQKGIPKSIFDCSDDDYSYYEDEDEYEDEDDYQLQKQLTEQRKPREEEQKEEKEMKNKEKEEEKTKGVVENKSNARNETSDKQKEEEERKLERRRVSEILTSGEVLKSVFDRDDDSEYSYEDDESWDSKLDAELTINLDKPDHENDKKTDKVAYERKAELKQEKGMQDEPITQVHEIKGENEVDHAVFKLPERKAIGEDDEDNASLTKKQSDKTRGESGSKAGKSTKDSVTVKPSTKDVDDDEEEDGDYGQIQRRKSGSKIKGINAEANKRKQMGEIKTKLTDKGKIIDPLHQEYDAKHDPDVRGSAYFQKPSKKYDDESDEELEAEVIEGFGESVKPMHEIKIVPKSEKEAGRENKKSAKPTEDQKSVYHQPTESDKSDSAKSRGPKPLDVKGNVKMTQKPKERLSDPTVNAEGENYEPDESYYPDTDKTRRNKTTTGRDKPSEKSTASTQVPLGVLKPGDVEVESGGDDMEQDFTFDFPKNVQKASTQPLGKADPRRSDPTELSSSKDHGDPIKASRPRSDKKSPKESSTLDEEKPHKSLSSKSGGAPKTAKDSGPKSKSDKDSKHPIVKEKSESLKPDGKTKTHSKDPKKELIKTPSKSSSSLAGKETSGDLPSRKEDLPKSSSQNIPKLTGAIKTSQKPAHRLTDHHEDVEGGDYEPDEAYYPDKIRPRQERGPSKLDDSKVDKSGNPVIGVDDTTGRDTRPGVLRPGFVDISDRDNESDFVFDPRDKIQKSSVGPSKKSAVSKPLKRTPTREEELEPVEVGSTPGHKHDIRIKPNESPPRMKTDDKKPTLKPGDVVVSDDNSEADFTFGPPKPFKQPEKKDAHGRLPSSAKSEPKTDSKSKDKENATPHRITPGSVDYDDTPDTDYTFGSPADKKTPSSKHPARDDEELEPEEIGHHPTSKHDVKIKTKDDDKRKKPEPSTKNRPEDDNAGSLKSGDIRIDEEPDDFNVALPLNNKAPSKSAQNLSTKPTPGHETKDVKDTKKREPATSSRPKKDKGVELEPEEIGTPKGKVHGVKLKPKSEKDPDKDKEQSATKKPSKITPGNVGHDDEPDTVYTFGLPSKDEKPSHPKIDKPNGKTSASQPAKNANSPKGLKQGDVDYDSTPDADYTLPIKKGTEKPPLKTAKQSGEDEELESDEIERPQPPNHDVKLKPKDKPTDKSDPSKSKPSEKTPQNKEKPGDSKPKGTRDGTDADMPSTKDQAKKSSPGSSDKPRLKSGKPEHGETKPSNRRPINSDEEEIEPDELDIPKPNKHDIKIKPKYDKEPSKQKPSTKTGDNVNEKVPTLKPGDADEDESTDFTFGPRKNEAPKKPSKKAAPTTDDEELEPDEIGKPIKPKHDVKLKPKGDTQSDAFKTAQSEPKKPEEKTKNPALSTTESPDTDYTFGLPSKKAQPKIPSTKEKPQNIEDEDFEPDEIGGPIKPKHDVKLKPKADKMDDKKTPSKDQPESKKPRDKENDAKKPGENKQAKLKKAPDVVKKPTEKPAVKPTGLKPGDVENDDSPEVDYTFGSPLKPTSIPIKPSDKHQPKSDEELGPDELTGPSKPNHDVRLKPKASPSASDDIPKKPTTESKPAGTGKEPAKITRKDGDAAPDADYIGRLPKPTDRKKPDSKTPDDEEYEPEELEGSSPPSHDIKLKPKTEKPNDNKEKPTGKETETKPSKPKEKLKGLKPTWAGDDYTPDADFTFGAPTKSSDPRKQEPKEFDPELISSPKRPKHDVKLKLKPSDAKKPVSSTPGTLVPGDVDTIDDDVELVTVGLPKDKPRDAAKPLGKSPPKSEGKPERGEKPSSEGKKPKTSKPLIPEVDDDMDAKFTMPVLKPSPKEKASTERPKDSTKPEKKIESPRDKPAVASNPKEDKKETPKDKPKQPKDGTTSSKPNDPKEPLKSEDKPKELSKSPSKPKEIKPGTGDPSFPSNDSLKPVEKPKERSKSPSAKPDERPRLSKPKSDEKKSSDKPEPDKKVSLKPVDKSKDKPEPSSSKSKNPKDALKPVPKDSMPSSKPSADIPQVAGKPKDSLKPVEKPKDRSKSPSSTKEKQTDEGKDPVPKLASSKPKDDKKDLTKPDVKPKDQSKSPSTKPKADSTKAKPEETSKEKKPASNKSKDEEKPKDSLNPTEKPRDRSKSLAKKPEEKPKVADKPGGKAQESLKPGETPKERSKSPAKKPEDKVKLAKETPKDSLKPADKPKERSKSPSAKPEDKAKAASTPKKEAKDHDEKPKSSSSKTNLEKPKDSLKPDEKPRGRSKSPSKKPDERPKQSSSKPTDEKPKTSSSKPKEGEKPKESLKTETKPKETSKPPSKKPDDKAPKAERKPTDSLKPDDKPRDRSKSPSKKPESKPKSSSSKSKEDDKPKESLKPGDNPKERSKSPAKKPDENPKSTSEGEKPKDSLKPGEKPKERSKSPSKKPADKGKPSENDDKPKESVKPKDKTKESAKAPSEKPKKDGDKDKDEPEDNPKTKKAPTKEGDDEKKRPKEKKNPKVGEEDDDSEPVNNDSEPVKKKKTKKSPKKPKKKDPDAEDDDAGEISGDSSEPDDKPKLKRRRRIKPKDDENDDEAEPKKKGRRGRSRSKKPTKRPKEPEPEEEPPKPKWVPPPRPPPDVYEMPPQEKPLVERLREEKIDPRKFYSKKTHVETNIPFVIPWEQAPALITQEGMGAFGAQRSAKAHVNDGHLKLTQGELKSENTLTLFEEGAKSVASQKGERSFGARRLNVDKVVDSHKYESDPKLKLCETVIPQVNRGLLTSQTGMEFGNLRHQTTKVKYAKGMTPGFDKEGNKYLSRQFKPNSTEVAGSNLIDTRRAIVQNVNGVELRMCPESDGIIPKLFSTQDIELKSGADFGSFRPLHTESEGGYRMTYDEEVKCKMAIPFQTAPSLLYFTNQ
uniref:Protein CDV3 homolog n=1 Tax=Bursaphelenchus xylophilus TaxID=6326 RepID=A0A1I7SMP9_BURXY